MSNNTYTGKNVEAAVAKAAKATGVEPGDLDYEILAGKTGGFALIKVSSGKKSAPELVEKLSGDGVNAAGTIETDDSPREARDDRRERRDRGDRDDRRGCGRGRDRDRGDRGDRDRGRGRGRGRDRDRGDRDDRRGHRRPQRQHEELIVPEDGPTEVNLTAAEDAELGPRGEKAIEVVRDILAAMGFGMEGTVSENDQNVRIDLQSGVYHDAFAANDLEVLDALEHLVDKIVNATGDDRKKVVIDSMGVKAKADVDLGESARHLAERAIEEGRTFKLGPLDPRSRRLVHLTLKEVDGVHTKSEGEGVFRRVCIIPKNTGDAGSDD